MAISASADEFIYPPLILTAYSEDSTVMVDVIPREYGDSVSCRALVYWSWDKKRTFLAREINLINPLRPGAVFVSNDASWLVTQDEYDAAGRGGRVIVIYDSSGQVVHQYALEDLAYDHQSVTYATTTNLTLWGQVDGFNNTGDSILVNVSEGFELDSATGRPLAPVWDRIAIDLKSGAIARSGLQSIPDQTGAPDVAWQRKHGTEHFEAARSLALLPDDQIVLAGNFMSYGNHGRTMVVRCVEQNGKERWSSYPRAKEQSAAACLLMQDTGEIVVGGKAWDRQPWEDPRTSDMYVVALDQRGEETWSWLSGFPAIDSVACLTQLDRDRLLVCGAADVRYGEFITEACIVELKPPDAVIDTLCPACRCVSGIAGVRDAWIAVGYAKTFPAWIVPADPADPYGRPPSRYLDPYAHRNAAVVCVSEVADSMHLTRETFHWLSGWDIPAEIVACEDGGWIVVGGSGGSPESTAVNCAHSVFRRDERECCPAAYAAFVAKYDMHGDTVWAYRFDGRWNDQAKGVVIDRDGGVVVVGFTTSYGAGLADVLVFKLTSEGQLLWARTIGGDRNDYGNDILLTDDGGYLLAGGTRSFDAGGTDMYLVKLRPMK